MAEEFELVAGEPLVSEWVSSPGIRRCFASCCGSPLFKRIDAIPQVLALRMGSLDSDPGRTVEVHGFVSSKAPWVTIDDDLPQEVGGAPFGAPLREPTEHS